MTEKSRVLGDEMSMSLMKPAQVVKRSEADIKILGKRV